jgi:hypothetical protein
MPAVPKCKTLHPRRLQPAAPGGQRHLLPLLGVGFSSARRLLSKPPKLEATKWHSIGHLQPLQYAIYMIGNSEPPQAVPGSPTACQPLGMEQARPQSLGIHFFSHMDGAEGGEAREHGTPWPPPPLTPWPTAAPGGAAREGGGGCTALAFMLFVTRHARPAPAK